MAYLQRTDAIVATSAPAFAEMTLLGTQIDSTIVVVISQSGTGTGRTYTVTDSVNGAYDLVTYTNPGRGCWVFKHAGIAGGDIAISVNVSSGSSSFSAIAFECNDIDPGEDAIPSSFSGSATSTHYCGADGDIDTTTGSFVVTATALSGSTTTQTPNAAFVEGIKPTGSSTQYFQVGYFTSALTNQRGEWVQTGTARSGTSLIVAFPLFGGGASPTSSGDWACLLA